MRSYFGDGFQLDSGIVTRHYVPKLITYCVQDVYFKLGQAITKCEFNVHSIQFIEIQQASNGLSGRCCCMCVRLPSPDMRVPCLSTVRQALEVLPVAPPQAPRQLTEKETQRLEEQEEDTLRELRLFLRDVTNRLAQDKRFKAFTKPVDLEEVTFFIPNFLLP